MKNVNFVSRGVLPDRTQISVTPNYWDIYNLDNGIVKNEDGVGRI
jgi:hypothetical protein